LGVFLTAVGPSCIEVVALNDLTGLFQPKRFYDSMERGVKNWQGSLSALVHFHFSCLARNYLDLADL